MIAPHQKKNPQKEKEFKLLTSFRRLDWMTSEKKGQLHNPVRFKYHIPFTIQF